MKNPITLLTSLFLSFLVATAAHGENSSLRGLRVDPGYFSRLFPDDTIEEIALNIVQQASQAGTNTLFLYAYSPLHGAYYPTDYQYAEVEEHMGRQNAFAVVYSTARAHGLKVVAVIPVNDFKLVWQEHPEWRSKLRDGRDYKPFTRTHYLSAWHPKYRSWYQGFIEDLLQKFPDLYALEAVEPTVDCFWTGDPDYNPAATAEFRKRYPKGTLGDSNWKKLRAKGLTDLVAIMSRLAHRKKIQSAVVHTWPPGPNGKLMSSNALLEHVGFDFNGVLNLKGEEKLDLINGEFLWQQWAGEYGGTVFTPEWTRKAALDFIAFVNGRSSPIIHVEISSWHGQTHTVTPTLHEFQRTLQVIHDLGYGIDVYDHSQIQDREAWEALSYWHPRLQGLK